MDVCLVIKRRLAELELEQRDLAAAAGVTESYISQLLTRKKLPPVSGRTDIYDRIEKFLKFSTGKLAKLADHQRKEELKRNLLDPPIPLFEDVRKLLLHKGPPDKVKQIRTIFEKQPFGELERLVAQKLLDVAKKVAKDQSANEPWLQSAARISGQSYAATRVSILKFREIDVFNVSIGNCLSLLDLLVESWTIDLSTFAMQIVLNRKLVPVFAKSFEFLEIESGHPTVEPGFKEFINKKSLSGNVTREEMEYLKQLKFNGKRPTPIFYYRELQNLRDPLHFRSLKQDS